MFLFFIQHDIKLSKIPKSIMYKMQSSTFATGWNCLFVCLFVLNKLVAKKKKKKKNVFRDLSVTQSVHNNTSILNNLL